MQFFVVEDKVVAHFFKDEIIPLLKAKDRLKISQDLESNHVTGKGRPLRKISYKIFEKQYGYDIFLDISPFPTPTQLTDFLCGIQNCVTAVGKCIFDRNITFALPLTCDELD